MRASPHLFSKVCLAALAAAKTMPASADTGAPNLEELQAQLLALKAQQAEPVSLFPTGLRPLMAGNACPYQRHAKTR